MLVHPRWQLREMSELSPMKAVQIQPKSRRLDFSNALELEKYLNEFIKNRGFDCIALDLRHVAYMDSCALGIMVEAYREICGSGRFCLCRVHPHITNVLKLTRLDEVFSIYDTCSEIFESAA